MEIDLGRHRKARAWLGFPLEPFAPAGIERVVIEAQPSERAPEERSLALELVVPKGPRTLYAMLGGRWRGGGKGFELAVPFTTSDCVLWPDSGALSFDPAFSGLPSEFVQSIVAGARRVGERGLPAGELEICCAAFTAAGSSGALFDFLVGALLELLVQPDLDLEIDPQRVLVAAP